MGLFTLPGNPLHLQAARAQTPGSHPSLRPAAPRTNPHLGGSPLWGEASQQGKVSPHSPPAVPRRSLIHIPERGASRLSLTRAGYMPFLDCFQIKPGHSGYLSDQPLHTTIRPLRRKDLHHTATNRGRAASSPP